MIEGLCSRAMSNNALTNLKLNKLKIHTLKEVIQLLPQNEKKKRSIGAVVGNLLGKKSSKTLV